MAFGGIALLAQAGCQDGTVGGETSSSSRAGSRTTRDAGSPRTGQGAPANLNPEVLLVLDTTNKFEADACDCFYESEGFAGAGECQAERLITADQMRCVDEGFEMAREVQGPAFECASTHLVDATFCYETAGCERSARDGCKNALDSAIAECIRQQAVSFVAFAGLFASCDIDL